MGLHLSRQFSKGPPRDGHGLIIWIRDRSEIDGSDCLRISNGEEWTVERQEEQAKTLISPEGREGKAG